MISSEREVAQLECHYDQFPGSSRQDMGDKGSIFWFQENDVNKQKNLKIQLFSRTDGNWQINPGKKGCILGYIEI